MNPDEIARSYSLLSSLKNNIPNAFEVEERWVSQYNAAIEKIEKVIGADLSEFKILSSDLYRSVSSSSFNGDVSYSPGLWCEKSVLMHKLDAILTYFSFHQTSQKRQIGFDLP
ncbi:MAG: hypothetical protein HYT79_00300 [Elusimicrobia bacterium]|nr:hypothetical protein [Elusimicrobiota bacterium]